MKSTYKQIPMAARYLINTVLIIAFLVVGNLIISSGLINRAQSSVVLQVGIYIILAVSLNIVHRLPGGSCPWVTRALWP